MHGQGLPSRLDVTLVRLRSQREEITFPRVKIDLLIAPVSFNVEPSDFEYSSRSLPACHEQLDELGESWRHSSGLPGRRRRSCRASSLSRPPASPWSRRRA